MKTKRKISIRKILQMLLTVVVSSGCVIAMVSASNIEDSKTLTSIAVHFKNDKKYNFIEENEILNLAINSRDIDVMHTPISKLDIHSMEQAIMADPWVAHAQVFIDKDGVLQMYVTQRQPVARVFQQDSRSYYLDGTLSIMPLSKNYIYYTTVVTNVPELKNDSAGWALRQEVVMLVNAIRADTFWNAQISQVIVDTAGTFELMPVLGSQKILFGDTSRIKDKLNNLFVFYKDVLNRIGWDKYETLDVRFQGQVVASPSLPYNGPVDKAVNKMNWIAAEMAVEHNAKKDSSHVDAAKTGHLPLAKAPVKQAGKSAVSAKSTQKPGVKATAKKATKGVDKNKQKAKQQQKTKPDNSKKNKTDNKQKNDKQAAPKYVYPGNKSK